MQRDWLGLLLFCLVVGAIVFWWVWQLAEVTRP